MAMSYLKVYLDFDEKTDELSDAERARLLLAMFYYAKTGERKQLTGNERFMYKTFIDQIDRDKAAYVAKVSNGKMGGRPASKNQEKPNDNLNKANETEDNLNLKNKNKIKNKIKEDTLRPPDTDRRFEKFWSVYPRHEGKQDARKAFDKLKVDDALLETMVSAILKQKQSEQWSEPRYIPHPSTWLNGHRWEDEPTKAVGSKPKLLRSQDYHQRQYNGSDMEKTLGVDELYTEDVS